MNSKTKVLKRFLFSMAFSFGALCAMAQLEKAKESLVDIYKVYDNMKELSFEVKYTYDTDTLFGNFKHDELKGKYVMSGKKALYSLGDIDFMQNDSFLIAIYNKEKFIVVGDPQSKGAGGLLPMRAQLDTLFANAGNDYDVTTRQVKNSTEINFTAREKSTLVSGFRIRFNTTTHYLEALQYNFSGITENYNNEPEELREKLVGVMRKNSLLIEFTNYSTSSDVLASAYDENNYVIPQGNTYKPVQRYQGFTVQNTKRRF